MEHLTKLLSGFLRRGDHVLICLPEEAARRYEHAARQCGTIPELCCGDYRWKNLLWLAFSKKVRAMVAPPSVLLGISKLARATGTPLYLRNAVAYGDLRAGWIREGITNCLDCRIWDAELPEADSERIQDQQLENLAAELVQWTSVLDCRLTRGVGGLEIECVVFAGEKLPNLPSCAKLKLRSWDARADVPFWIEDGWRHPIKYEQNH